MSESKTAPARPREAAPSRPAAADRRVPTTPPSVPTPPATRRLAPALFSGSLVLADLLALAGGVALTWWVRFGSGWLPSPLGTPPFAPYLATVPVVVLLGLAVFQDAGLYRRHRRSNFPSDFTGAVRATLRFAILLAAIGFFYRDFSFSRAFLAIYALSLPGLVAVARRGARSFQRALRDRGIGVERVGIVGDGPLGDRLSEKMTTRTGAGIVVAGRLSAVDLADEATGDALRPLRVRSFVRTHRIDRVVVVDPTLGHDARLDLVETCHEAGARCEFVSDLFEVMTGRVHVEQIDGIPLVGSRLHPLGRIDRIKKRTLDLVGSSVGLLLLSPLFVFLAALVRLDSKGPALYRQPRLGRDGREFDIVKFRSMPIDAEAKAGPVRTTKRDSRATRVGRILRRTSLDELPQLWNVWRGEMSLVGPRPERRVFVEQFRQDIPRYLERHGVKSGITGWAQAHGLRGDTSIEERTRYDIWYVENWSLGLDLKILFLTLFRFLSQEDAY